MKKLKYVQHPWEVLKEELEYRKITWKDFAKVIGKSTSELSELLNAKRNMTARWAILIWESLDISPEFWLWMQRDYDINNAKRKFRHWTLEKVKNRAIKAKMIEVRDSLFLNRVDNKTLWKS